MFCIIFIEILNKFLMRLDIINFCRLKIKNILWVIKRAENFCTVICTILCKTCMSHFSSTFLQWLIMNQYIPFETIIPGLIKSTARLLL